MRYQSLLFPVVLITAIASLLTLQACAKNDRAGSKNDIEIAENNRTGSKYDLVDTENDRAGKNNDRASTDNDPELAYAIAQSLSYLQGCYKSRLCGDREVTQYMQYELKVKDFCLKNNRDACESLRHIQSIRSGMANSIQMESLIGQ